MSDFEPISLIFLAYNEASTIKKEILAYHEKIIKKIPGSEFIVAEDGSTDGTTEIIKELVEEIGIIHLTSSERKGYTRALADAVCSAKNEYVFFSDTGLKHDPDDFWDLYQLREDYDLIVGKKTKRQDQLYRQLLTYSYNRYLRYFFKLDNVSDADSGFRLFNKKVIDAVFRKGLKFKALVNSEVVLRTIFSGLLYREVPVSYVQREGASRGLPLKTIPQTIFKVIHDIKELRDEFSQKLRTDSG